MDSAKNWREFTDAPIIGEADPWFRVVGVQDTSGGDLDAYVITNGKNNNIDTMYSYGHQTVIIKDDVGSFIPVFEMAGSEQVYVDKSRIFVDGEPYSVGDPLTFEDGVNARRVWFNVMICDGNGEHVKNYNVSFVKQAHGPQLYVAGPTAPEIRSVFLDEYFEYKHDIFIANVGDEPLKNLRVELDATNVALDSYWTIGGEGNDTLAACPEVCCCDAVQGKTVE